MKHLAIAPTAWILYYPTSYVSKSLDIQIVQEMMESLLETDTVFWLPQIRVAHVTQYATLWNMILTKYASYFA